MSLAAGFLVVVWLTTYHPAYREPAIVTCPDNTPVLSPGQAVKVLTWNVQFMAGKNYVFFFDVFDGNGPDAGLGRNTPAIAAHSTGRRGTYRIPGSWGP